MKQSSERSGRKDIASYLFLCSGLTQQPPAVSVAACEPASKVPAQGELSVAPAVAIPEAISLGGPALLVCSALLSACHPHPQPQLQDALRPTVVSGQ